MTIHHVDRIAILRPLGAAYLSGPLGPRLIVTDPQVTDDGESRAATYLRLRSWVDWAIMVPPTLFLVFGRVAGIGFWGFAIGSVVAVWASAPLWSLMARKVSHIDSLARELPLGALGSDRHGDRLGELIGELLILDRMGYVSEAAFTEANVLLWGLLDQDRQLREISGLPLVRDRLQALVAEAAQRADTELLLGVAARPASMSVGPRAAAR